MDRQYYLKIWGQIRLLAKIRKTQYLAEALSTG